MSDENFKFPFSRVVDAMFIVSQNWKIFKK